MKKLILFIYILSSYLLPQTNLVLHAKIDGEIDLGLVPYVKRVIREAEEKNASAIIFEINTFGGRVDAATQIKDAILESKVLTIAYINKRAISAGALIALSNRKIVMSPGSSFGASTVVDQEGKKQSEKYQSFMRSEMRSTAEKNNRRTDIAEGMVDEKIVVVDLHDDDKSLITITSEEALKCGYADTLVSNIQEVLSFYKLNNAKVVNVSYNWAEVFVGFLNNPVVSSLLIMIGLIGLYTEIKAPGWNVGGTIAVVAFALFFGSSFILQIASLLEILMFIAGVILLILEIFVIPGFGITGVLGIIFVVVSIFLSLFNTDFYFDFDQLLIAIVQVGAAFGASIVAMVLLFKYLPQSKTFHKFVLDTQSSSKEGFISNPVYDDLINLQGESVTSLRPAGIVTLNGKRYDVVTEGEFIEKGKKIYVARVEGVKIIVKEVN